ncbi:D-cysteine desulfhydrase [Saccharopolyspora sp. NPDC050642]|uniref:D-cysteine desulfhydrase n=1 Tax=Saccharopolyspora sp. NPDC050642 TaxID=3157099 RepID=UPI0033EEE11F
MVALVRYPRYPLGHFPTPLEPLTRLTDRLRGTYRSVPLLWIKRDDCTGLATGGNKTRKLEFLVGEALQQGADTLITQGAIQSNHARQTAAAAVLAGMHCSLLLECRQESDEDYERSGNVLLDEILGAQIVDRLPTGTDMQAAMEELAERLRGEGRRPFVIPVGGSNPTGALGYVACAEELDAAPIPIDWVVHATGSAGTQAGLVAGLRLLRHDAKVLGVCVSRNEDLQRSLVHQLAQDTAAKCGADIHLPEDAVLVDDRWVGGGYGVPTDGMVEAVRLLATTEGILLDPVYSGKAFAGLLGNIAEGRFKSEENVVFLHTGGSVGLFAYRSTFSPSTT